MTTVEFHPVGAAELPALGRLFDRSRSTRHCWCTAFCSTSWQFATGWYGGGNRRRFEAATETETEPMGIVAIQADDTVGWASCGPRSRYTTAIAGRSSPLRRLDRAEDRDVWLVACLVVAPRQQPGILGGLVRASVELARDRGATAIEAWPTAHGIRRPSLAHLGSEALFARAGFGRAGEPRGDRVIMRRQLTGRPPDVER